MEWESSEAIIWHCYSLNVGLLLGQFEVYVTHMRSVRASTVRLVCVIACIAVMAIGWIMLLVGISEGGHSGTPPAISIALSSVAILMLVITFRAWRRDSSPPM